ncbi:ThiF family adenylyltransferase [Candidatus Woesearchaeota archaeon]|nr:ThiF family adenylyltransferase [Candidatus Woesearchaeota archaeon]
MHDAGMRYSRQELVIGKDAQKKIESSSAVVIGLGALGTVTSELLVMAGIGTLKIIDRDRVEESNLQRQSIYSEQDIGQPKAEVAMKKLKGINSKIVIASGIADLDHGNIHEMLEGNDIILDCTDNLYARFLINDYSRKSSIPWVYAGAIRENGNVMAITKDTPCFRCIVEEVEDFETCDTVGVTAAVCHVIASIQSDIALRVITGTFKKQELISLGMNSLRLTKSLTSRSKKCPACNGSYEYLSGEKEKNSTKYCSGIFVFRMVNLNIESISKRLIKLGGHSSDKCIFFDNVTIFPDGKVMVKAESIEDAKSEISRYIGM